MDKYEIGVHFKSNASKSIKEQTKNNIINLSTEFQIITVVNKDILQAIVYTDKEVEIAKMLKETKQIRYFYIELIKD